LKLFKTDFFKNAGTLFSGSLMAQAVSFGALYFLAKMYSPAQFGSLEIFVKLAGMGTVIAGLRYELAIVAVDEETEAEDIVRLSLWLNFLISIILFLVVLCLKESIASLFNISQPNILYFVPLAIWLMGSAETLVSWGNRQRKYKTISNNRVLSSVSGTSYKLLHPFIKIAGNGLVIGQVLSQIVAFFHLLFIYPIKILNTPKSDLINLAKKHKSFSLYSTPAAFLNILATSMPVFMIAAFDGQDATGYFANAFKLSYLPMSMIAMALGQVFFERNARLKNDKAQTAAMSHQLFDTMFWVALIPVVVLTVWGDQIALLLLGEEWAEAGIYIQITMPFYFAMYLTTSFSSAFVTYDKLNVQLIYNLFFLTITAGALYLLYHLGGNTRSALAWFTLVGVILRIGVLNYFFYLFGKNLIAKTIFAIVLTGILVWLGFGIKEGF